MKTWLKYMKMVNKNDPDAAIITSLTARYGDAKLAKMIVEAKTMPKTAQIAGKLEHGQIQAWIKNHESVEDVFVLLALDKVGDNLFRTPQFKSWVAFATASIPKNPEVSIMMALKTRYNDKSLAVMIESATKVPSTEAIATKLQINLLDRWYLEKKKPGDVLVLLQINKPGKNIIGSPEFNTWAIYTTMLSKKDPEASMISTMTNHYGDEALSAMLETAKNVRETKAMADDLQNAQFKSWLARELTPKEFLNLLGMQNTLREPNDIVWYMYKAFYETAKATKTKS
ncbi:unnamed protein product [Phytophthora fragariaefolia]|uniref:Unnamed protein product n=1 Tax=Phytophthora fragariaefolia TaxID=1490495 RepID=A0A9W6Y1X1_9STRA|nr:unnamed protein product [Phytophthora fragariaefolia]